MLRKWQPIPFSEKYCHSLLVLVLSDTINLTNMPSMESLYKNYCESIWKVVVLRSGQWTIWCHFIKDDIFNGKENRLSKFAQTRRRRQDSVHPIVVSCLDMALARREIINFYYFVCLLVTFMQWMTFQSNRVWLQCILFILCSLITLVWMTYMFI